MHRSVVLAELFHTKMLKAGYRATVVHRDMEREQEGR
jgi:RNase adaptor protein for sRNA GlmZ degradation